MLHPDLADNACLVHLLPLERGRSNASSAGIALHPDLQDDFTGFFPSNPVQGRRSSVGWTAQTSTAGDLSPLNLTRSVTEFRKCQGPCVCGCCGPRAHQAPYAATVNTEKVLTALRGLPTELPVPRLRLEEHLWVYETACRNENWTFDQMRFYFKHTIPSNWTPELSWDRVKKEAQRLDLTPAEDCPEWALTKAVFLALYSCE